MPLMHYSHFNVNRNQTRHKGSLGDTLQKFEFSVLIENSTWLP